MRKLQSNTRAVLIAVTCVVLYVNAQPVSEKGETTKPDSYDVGNLTIVDDPAFPAENVSLVISSRAALPTDGNARCWRNWQERDATCDLWGWDNRWERRWRTGFWPFRCWKHEYCCRPG